MARARFQSSADGENFQPTLSYDPQAKTLIYNKGAANSQAIVLQGSACLEEIRSISYTVSATTKTRNSAHNLSLDDLKGLVGAIEAFYGSTRKNIIQLTETNTSGERLYFIALRPSNSRTKPNELKLVLSPDNIDSIILKIRVGESIADLVPKKGKKVEEPKDPSVGPA